MAIILKKVDFLQLIWKFNFLVLEIFSKKCVMSYNIDNGQRGCYAEDNVCLPTLKISKKILK